VVRRLLLLVCNASSVFVNNLFCNSNKNVKKNNNKKKTKNRFPKFLFLLSLKRRCDLFSKLVTCYVLAWCVCLHIDVEMVNRPEKHNWFQDIAYNIKHQRNRHNSVLFVRQRDLIILSNYVLHAKSAKPLAEKTIWHHRP